MPRKPGEKWTKLNEPIKRRVRLESQKEYNLRRPDRHKFYSTTRWRKLRQWYRTNHPVCEECAALGLTVRADVVDHIISIEDGGNPMAVSNLQSLCHGCHNRKHGGGVGQNL